MQLVRPSLVAVGLVASATFARAEDAPQTKAAPSHESAPAPMSQPAPAAVPGAPIAPSAEPSFQGVNRYWIDDHLRRFAINLNPAGLIIGRFSADLTLVPFKHHALVFTPFYRARGASLLTSQDFADSIGAAGFEASYHYYTGNRGPNGLFIGPGFLYERQRVDTGPNFDALGWFVDAGVQGVTNSGFMAGFGIGFQWKHRVDGTAWITAARALMMFGYAF